LLFAMAGVAHGVEFDENLSAPRAVSGAEARDRLGTLATRVAGPGAADALERVRDRALAREHTDARWIVGQLVDARADVPELEGAGFEKKEDGSYVIDGTKRPEWTSLAERVLLLSQESVIQRVEAAFTARGFRPEDLVSLRAYVKTHDLKRALDEGQLPLMISASRKAKKLQKLKRLDDRFMASYFYQKRLQQAESERAWVVGLLDSLPPQAQRIVVSYFAEVAPASVISPTDNAPAYQHERELLLKPDFERLVRTAFEEGTL
jgi:hypothetical protein